MNSIGSGFLHLENAWTGRTVLDEQLTFSQRLLGGALGSAETFLVVLPAAKGVTAAGGAAAKGMLPANSLANIAFSQAGKIMFTDLTFHLGERTMKALLNTSAGQAMLRGYNKVYYSRYNLTIAGEKVTRNVVLPLTGNIQHTFDRHKQDIIDQFGPQLSQKLGIPIMQINNSPKTRQALMDIIHDFMGKPDTLVLQGAYKKIHGTFYIDPKTNFTIGIGQNNQIIMGFELSKKQLNSLKKTKYFY